MKVISQERGLVSLLTTIIVSLLLTVIVISMVGLMALEQHQATDNADSVRAYYAAEAGVENGLLQVENALDGTTPGGLAALPAGCSNSGTALSNGAEYTCQQFSNETDQATGSLTADGTPLQLDLSGLTNLNHLLISWNETSDASVTSSFTGPKQQFPNTNAPDGTVYNYPAVLELTSAGYPTVFTNSSQISTNTVTVEPADSGADSIASYNAGGVSNGACSATVTPTNPYNCSVTINYGTGENYILQLEARYAGTHYQVQACADSSNPCDNVIPIPDEYETIDVTARVGNAYRRLVEKVPITSGVADLNYVVFADNTICKNFSIVSNTITNQCP